MSGIFVAYYRVSTGKQALSGLGLEAQQRAVRDHIDNRKGHLIAEFSETGSGRKNNRSKLKSALALCRLATAKLAIARLDRLSRNVEFVFGTVASTAPSSSSLGLTASRAAPQ